ncbi:MAG: hypothetical protein ACREYF_08905 [Gammaproteobacteria bacterium]
MTEPTPAATYERARRLANVALWTVDLQCRRLRNADEIDETFLFRLWADFDFLVIALTRLRRAVSLAGKAPILAPPVAQALAAFDAALPQLKKLRDTAEHIDDYAVDRGRVKSVKRQDLEVSSLTMEGPTLEWLGFRLNTEEALNASQALFESLKGMSALLKRRA